MMLVVDRIPRWVPEVPASLMMPESRGGWYLRTRSSRVPWSALTGRSRGCRLVACVAPPVDALPADALLTCDGPDLHREQGVVDIRLGHPGRLGGLNRRR